MAKSIEVLTTIPFPESVMQRLREVTPHLHITMHPAEKADEIAMDLWNRTEILYTDIVVPEVEAVPNLRWIQYHYAGVDFLLDTPLPEKKDLQITTMSGASAIQEGEYILGMLLGLGHHFAELFQNQLKHDWPTDRWEKFSPRELTNATVGIIGYGSIGREVARLLQPFNCKILATKRDAMNPVDTGYNIEGHGDPEGNLFHRLYPIQALKAMIKECDFVIMLLPLTAQTRGIYDEEVIRAMKPGSFLVVASRGGIVDESALYQALSEHAIAGAALDVFSREPFPAENPLWKLPNVIMTPHVSGFSPNYKERAGMMFAENLERYLHGERLLNKWDPERSY